MKQFTFEYTTQSKLVVDLGRVADWAAGKGIRNIWVQVYVADEQGECFLPIRDTIALCLPSAKYVVTHAGLAFSANEISQSPAMVVCNLFEDPDTRLEMKQFLFDPANYEKTVDEAIAYVNANPWIRLISFNAGADLTGVQNMNRLAESIDPDIVMTGGAAATITMSVPAMVFSSEGEMSTTALVMTFIGGENFHARADVIVGWKGIGKDFTATKSEGSVLYEVDGAPAFDLYRKYLKIEAQPGMVVAQTIEFPLCYEADGMLFLRCPFILNEDGSITMMMNDLRPGQKIRLSFGSPDVILDGIAAKLNEIATFEPQVINVNSCLGRSFFWGENLSNELVVFRKVAACSGFLTGGELLRRGNRMLIFNETMVTTSMREGNKSPDGSGIRRVERSEKNYSLTQRLATFIDTVTSDLEAYNEIVRRMATTDALTELYNRRELENIIEKTAGEGKAFSLLMLDADNFKQINDSFGHREGDRVLRLLADSIRGAIEETGLDVCAGRWGGDEFLMICVSADAGDALRLAQVLQRRYHSRDAYPDFARTISIGIAAADGELDAAFQRVDEKLYEAKANGKGCIVS